MGFFQKFRVGSDAGVSKILKPITTFVGFLIRLGKSRSEFVAGASVADAR